MERKLDFGRNGMVTRLDPTVVPALPGFSVAEPVRNDDGSVTRFIYTPIIAWMVSPAIRTGGAFGAMGQFERPEVEPVTPDPIGRAEVWAIRYPDGQFLFPDDMVDAANADEAMNVASKALGEVASETESVPPSAKASPTPSEGPVNARFSG